MPIFEVKSDTMKASFSRLIDSEIPVLVDFYADWCAPCKILEPHIDRLAELHPDRLAVRKIDVIDWSSPVIRQAVCCR